jgi:hypothetical protein
LRTICVVCVIRRDVIDDVYWRVSFKV